jgi:hypothetical protein
MFSIRIFFREYADPSAQPDHRLAGVPVVFHAHELTMFPGSAGHPAEQNNEYEDLVTI